MEHAGRAGADLGVVAADAIAFTRRRWMMDGVQIIEGVIVDEIPIGIVVKHEIVVCHDPEHFHQDPRIECWGIEYRGHWVDVTLMNGRWHVRIDENPTTVRAGLPFDEAMAYVSQSLDGGV
jgi:hypothetical protein